MKLKYKLMYAVSCWSLKLNFEMELWSWISKLNFKVEVLSWVLQLKLKVDFRCWSLKFMFDVEIRSLSLVFKLEAQSWGLKMHLRLNCLVFIWSWSLKLMQDHCVCLSAISFYHFSHFLVKPWDELQMLIQRIIAAKDY